ncbi:alpha-galactosidase, partial [Enterococcus faecalis]|uniref:alpha-galactosidase n=1 Tax=Enterococcus faecalis TaxID=1351 RepID=UPI001AD64C84
CHHKQTNRGIAFHLIPNSSWEIAVSMNAIPGLHSYIQVEMGIDSDNLALSVNPGEEVNMPGIIYYEFKSKIDMDCWKLHRYCTDNMRYRKVPVMYNTWLYKFDKLSVENVKCQIQPAKDLGCEYFVIDAGWFGINPVWARGIGDWTESLTFGFKGNMIEIADAVRQSGMKFGLWLEIERAVDLI